MIAPAGAGGARMDMRIIHGGHIRQRPKRQAIAQRSITGHRKQHPTPHFPAFGAPFARRVPRRGLPPRLNRQDKPGRLGQPALKRPHHPRAFLGIVDFRIGRRGVVGQLRLTHDPVDGVFIDRLRKSIVHPQRQRGFAQKPFGIGRVDARIFGFGLAQAQTAARDQAGIMPHWHAVFAPIERIAPARQTFARIPFALSVVEQRSRREPVAQQPDQVIGKHRFGRSYRLGIPFARFKIAIAHKSRFATDGQPHIARSQIGIDLIAQRHQAVPPRIGKRFGDPHRLGNARHVHFEMEPRLDALHHRALDWRSRVVMRRRA